VGSTKIKTRVYSFCKTKLNSKKRLVSTKRIRDKIKTKIQKYWNSGWPKGSVYPCWSWVSHRRSK